MERRSSSSCRRSGRKRRCGQPSRRSPRDCVDQILLVDDASDDHTVDVAASLGIRAFVHQRNLGYGANQKTCYTEALDMRRGHRRHAAPRLPVRSAAGDGDGGDADLGRLRCGAGIADSRQHRPPGGMPRYKYVSNRVLTLVQNLLLGDRSSPSTTRAIARSRAACSRPCRWSRTPTTSCSTTRC